jgi:hypothetical protein
LALLLLQRQQPLVLVFLLPEQGENQGLLQGENQGQGCLQSRFLKYLKKNI